LGKWFGNWGNKVYNEDDCDVSDDGVEGIED